MSAKILALTIAAVAGLAMAVQGSLNSGLGRIIGTLESTLVVHGIGLLVVALLLFPLQLGQGSLTKVTEVPWYFFLGGVLSVVIIFGVISSIPRVGVANATTAIIVGQVGAAVLIDYLGLFGLERVPFEWTKGLGIAFLALGTRLMLN